MTIWLALDIGTTSAKAALMETKDPLEGAGRMLASTSCDYPTYVESGGIVEQNAADWWTAACTAARELDGAIVEGIAITGQMQDLILLDDAGEAIRPAILYNDTRATTEAVWINDRVGRDWLAQVTGYEQDAGSLLTKFRWLAAHEPQSLASATHLLTGAGDVVAQRLTGVFVTDTTTAGTTGLLDLQRRTWLDERTLATIELAPTRHLYPTLTPGGGQVGVVHEQGAAAFGVRAGIPVHLGPGDAGAITIGMQANMPGLPYAYIGTSGWIGAVSLEQGDYKQGVWSLPDIISDTFFCLAPLLTAGGNFEWMMQIMGAPDVATLIAKAVPHDWSRDPLIYLPYLNGERSPIKDPFARGAFIGLSAAHTSDDLSYAVLQGVAFALRHALEALLKERQSAGQGAARLLSVTGGGAQSPVWNQLLADVLNLKVVVYPETQFVGLVGAVHAAQQATNDAAQRAHRTLGLPSVSVNIYAEGVVQNYTPNKAESARHNVTYQWFRDAYPALKGLFADMGSKRK